MRQSAALLSEEGYHHTSEGDRTSPHSVHAGSCMCKFWSVDGRVYDLQAGFVQVGDSLEEFLLGATQDAKLRQLMMSMSEAIRTIAFKVHKILPYLVNLSLDMHNVHVLLHILHNSWHTASQPVLIQSLIWCTDLSLLKNITPSLPTPSKMRSWPALLRLDEILPCRTSQLGKSCWKLYHYNEL